MWGNTYTIHHRLEDIKRISVFTEMDSFDPIVVAGHGLDNYRKHVSKWL